MEARNHPKAIERIEKLVKSELTVEDVLEIHRLVVAGVLESAGHFRNAQVYIEGSDHVPPPAFEIPGLVSQLLERLRTNPEELRPIELAAVFHHRLVSIHPFDDGDRRVARLIMNLILMRNGYPLTIVRKTRAEPGSKVYVGTPAPNKAAASILQKFGFQQYSKSIRMRLGKPSNDRITGIYAIDGPMKG